MDGRIFLNLFHILLVAPFFLWIGVSRSNVPSWVYTTLLILGIVLLVYHGYKSVLRYQQKSNFIWVNLIHAFIVAPILLYIGMKKKDTPRPAYEMLLLVSFAALGYHLYELAMYYDFQ